MRSNERIGQRRGETIAPLTELRPISTGSARGESLDCGRRQSNGRQASPRERPTAKLGLLQRSAKCRCNSKSHKHHGEHTAQRTIAQRLNSPRTTRIEVRQKALEKNRELGHDPKSITIPWQ